MIEQYYAKHKITGEIFCHKGRYCFSEKGLIQSIRNDRGTWVWTKDKSVLFKCPMVDWEVRKVELT